MELSVVLPAHDEAAALPELIARLIRTLDGLPYGWELVVVDDGSTDATWPLLRRAAHEEPRLRAIRLSRNFGHQVALSAGLWAAAGDAVVTMDADLQHPPEVIPALVAKGREGFDVVYAVRSPADGEGRFKVGTARAFYAVLNRLTSLDLPHGGADFRYMSRPVVDALRGMPERNRFLRGMTRWVGFTQAVLPYDRAARLSGRSKYTLRRMVRFALDAIVAFSALPLRLASVLGLLVSLLGAVYLAYVVGARLFTDATVPGWTSVVVVSLLLGGVQLACLGIIGQYVGRMYEEVKGRPLFIVWEDTADPPAEHDSPRRGASLTGRLVRVPGRQG